MKRFMIVVISLMCLGLAVGTSAIAHDSGQATADVVVQVAANIAVQAATPLVSAGTIESGDFPATFVFTIDANKEQVKMMMEASGLYKGDDPTSTIVKPIPIETSGPGGAVQVIPTYGNALSPHKNILDWQGGAVAGAAIGLFPTIASETVAFESAQNGDYSQDVTYVITYNQDDPEKPIGEYSGKVRLTVLL
jgi:hypothetical protein